MSEPLRLLVEVAGDSSTSVYDFQQPFVLIGHHERADLRLPHPEVSQRQLYLQVLGGRVFGVHLSSRVPTWWGGMARASGWVAKDEPISFGPYQLRVLVPALEATDTASLADPLAVTPDAEPVALELLRDGAPPLPGAINRTLALIGHSPPCRVRIRDPRVSSVHGSFVRTPDGLWVVDLCGREGIRVNGIIARAAFLEDGDLLEIGGRRIRVRYRMHPSTASGDLVPVGGEEHFPWGIDETPDPTIHPLATIPGGADMAALERMLGPVLDRFTEFQNQTFEQFQSMLQALMQMLGSMMTDQRQFVREELQRLERLVQAGNERQGPAPQALPPAAPEAMSDKPAMPPAPSLPPAAAASSDAQMHLWLQGRIDSLRDQRASMWQRLLGFLRTPPSPDRRK
jgi:pSer/pThr/pTyr-binding forkhead associated (FHA) protein